MFLTLSCAAVAFLGAAPILQASESITDEISAKYLGRIDSAQKNEDWETLFHLYEEALRRHRYRVAPDPEHAGIQLGMVEYLIRRYAGLPQAAFDHYRLAMDGRAQQALEMAAREKDPLQLDRMLSLYFFSSMSDEYHDRLALQLQERGLFDDALLYWDRLLRYYPDSDIPPEVLLARMAVACQLAGSASQLSELVEFQAERKIDGFIWAGREKRKISEFLSSLKISPGRDNFSRPPPMPDVSRRTHGEQPRYVRNDVMWWTFEFETKAKSDPARRTGVVNQGLSDYPLLPAYCRLKGNPYVIFTDGFQVVSVNPDRVRRGSRIEGVYWRYPANGPLKISSTSRVYGVSYSPPYIGVTVEGEYAFATLYAQKRISPNNQDSFSGPTRLVCFQISTGRVVWSTDELYATVQGMERREQQAYDFLERNHAFSGPPLVRGGKVFLGICSSPSAEQEARVLCLDSRTGAPLWSTFLASLRSAGNRFRSRGGTLKPFLPMMVEEGGRLYVQTSLGVVAAIRSTTGNAVWLSRYRRDVKIPTWNVQTPNTLRPANAPLLYGGRVWILPQDSKVLLAFDRKTGESVLLPRVGLKGGVLPWAEIKRLLGVIDGWMVLGGASSYVLRLRDYYSGSLANANTAACGRGQIVGEDIYFSIESGGRNGSLGLYAGSGSWKKQWTSEWKGKNQKGNLLVAGNTLVVASDQIHFYSDVETVRDRFSSRVNQSPPRLDVLLSYAELMDQNGMREDAIEAYEEYVRLMKPVESEMGIYWKVRHRLHEIFLEYGEELATSSGTGILQYFRKAMAYAPDQETGAKMTWKIGAYLAKVGRNREAVEEFQKIIEKYPDYIFPVPSEKVAIRLGEYGRRMISGIRAKDPQACQGIEDRAGKALRNCSGDDLDGWKKIRRLYPDSRAAEKAAQFLLAAHLKREEWVEALVLQKERISPGDPRTLLNLLEKIGDRERLVSELKSWGREFGDQVVVVGEQHRRVHEIVRDWLQKIAAEQGPTPELPEGPLKRMGSPIKNILDGSLYALDPAGIIPPMFPPGAVLLQQGVSVELRNVEDGTRRWVVHHPSGYSGINVRAEGIRAKVHRVDPGSPGARAGIKPGDVIESVNGSYGTHESISRHLRSGKPGKGLRLQVRRGGKPLPYSFKLDTMPPDKGRSILWASFTRGYSLAIVWEDAVAAVDIRTGKVEWLFSTIPDSFSIREVRADEGKLFLYGSRKPGWMLVCLECEPTPPQGGH